MMKKMMTMLMMKAYNVRRFIQQQMYEVVQKLYIVADHEKDEKKLVSCISYNGKIDMTRWPRNGQINIDAVDEEETQRRF